MNDLEELLELNHNDQPITEVSIFDIIFLPLKTNIKWRKLRIEILIARDKTMVTLRSTRKVILKLKDLI